jgi:hypothetical protein
MAQPPLHRLHVNACRDDHRGVRLAAIVDAQHLNTSAFAGFVKSTPKISWLRHVPLHVAKDRIVGCALSRLSCTLIA